jgi:DNA-binding GntR family transcriptional regulator
MTRQTRADRVREALADDIIAGRSPPGTRLEEAGLARRFAVSRTPVREALRELAATGLARITPHQGAVVLRVSDGKLGEIFEAVAELEAVCSRLAALRMSAAERAGLEALHRHCGSLVRSGDHERYHEANAEFHAAVRRGSGNAVLQETVAALRRRFAPLSRAQFRGPGRLAHSYAEHEEIVRAIQRGDAGEAYRVAHRHVLSVRSAFADYAATHTAPDAAD